MFADPPSVFTVRSASAADAPSLGRLGALLVRLHHDFDPTRFIASTPRTPDRYAGFLDAQRQREDAVVLVAQGECGVIGYAYATLEGNDLMTLRGPAGVLHDLVVDPACRRIGVGRSSVDAMRAEMASRGVPRIVLLTAAKKEAAQRSCAAFGFRATMIEMTADLT